MAQVERAARDGAGISGLAGVANVSGLASLAGVASVAGLTSLEGDIDNLKSSDGVCLERVDTTALSRFAIIMHI